MIRSSSCILTINCAQLALHEENRLDGCRLLRELLEMRARRSLAGWTRSFAHVFLQVEAFFAVEHKQYERPQRLDGRYEHCT